MARKYVILRTLVANATNADFDETLVRVKFVKREHRTWTITTHAQLAIPTMLMKIPRADGQGFQARRIVLQVSGYHVNYWIAGVVLGDFHYPFDQQQPGIKQPLPSSPRRFCGVQQLKGGSLRSSAMG